MMTDHKPVRSIHADNLPRLALRASNTYADPLSHLLIMSGARDMDQAAFLLKISTAQGQAERNNAALHIAARYNAVTVLKGHHSLIVAANGELPYVQRSYSMRAAAGFAAVLCAVITAFLAHAYYVAYLAAWLPACASKQLVSLGCGVAANDMCHTTRLLLEEHSPCQA